MLSRRALRGIACTCQSQQRVAYTPIRWISSEASTSTAVEPSYTFDEEIQQDFHDRRQARQLTARLHKTKERIFKRGQDFVDKLYIQVNAGKGGDGGVAFHSEKFVEKGGPSGGNGGQGGNVYIRPVPHLSSLSTVKKKMRAHNGTPGQGSWMHGKRGEDLIIEVPYGTVIRERRDYSESEEVETEQALSETWSEWRKRLKMEEVEDPEAARTRKTKLFVLFPALNEDRQLLQTDKLGELEMSLLADERREALAREQKPPFLLDFDKLPAIPAGKDAQTQEDTKILILKGGQGGFGNPYFTSMDPSRLPKFATRGKMGESMRLELELKTLADVGLVGFPNAGKSTLLRALTHSKSTVASYAFTTLSPQIGTLIIYDDATYSTIGASSPIHDSSSPLSTDSEPRDRTIRPTHKEARQEKLRLTIADCPGLLPDASENVGLGFTFLRHIERSKLLIYVIDLSSLSPAKDLKVLRDELEAYTPGLSRRAKIIVANKADRVDENDASAVGAMKTKLAMIRNLVHQWQDEDGIQRVVMPMSAKMRGNVQPLVDSLLAALQEGQAAAVEE